MNRQHPSSSPETHDSGHLEVVDEILDETLDDQLAAVDGDLDDAEAEVRGVARERIRDSYVRNGRIDLEGMADDLRALGGKNAEMVDKIENAENFDDASGAFEYLKALMMAVLSGAMGMDVGTVDIAGGRNFEIDPQFAFDGFAIPPEFGTPRITSMPQSWRNVRSVGVHGGHRGVDIGIPQGAPILMTKNVKVLKVKNTGGKYVKVQYPDGTIAKFGHMFRVDVQEGQELGPGDSIGQVGSTGTSTGPHIHYETYRADGRLTDPFRTFDHTKAGGINVPDDYQYPFEGMDHNEAVAHSRAHRHNH